MHCSLGKHLMRIAMSQPYSYDLPEALIAHAPAEPRDSARLLVYHVAENTLIEDTFANISRYIPERALLILNDTQVVPARLSLMKSTGGTVRILFLVNEWMGEGLIKGLPDRKLKTGDVLSLDGRPVVEVISQDKEEFSYKVLMSSAEFRELLKGSGTTPLPPYIHSSLSEDEARTRYQTVFATPDVQASVAAPTASLHFTEGVFNSLDAKGVERAYVTLHVGRGTFSPVDVTNPDQTKLHSEPVFISANSVKAIAHAQKEGRTIVASGTTALRAIESAAEFIAKKAKTMDDHDKSPAAPYDMATDIFIKPPYDFKIANALITNFHLPGTSLLVLLDAFLQYRGAARSWRDIYEYAIAHGFRFYSFGDAMLVI